MGESIAGRERVGTISALTALWDEVFRDGGTRIAIVYGGEGSGKTAMLRALYRHCAWGQGVHGFWPHNFASVSGEPLLTRDIIHPTEGIGEESNDPSFIWWGIEAQPDHCAVQDCSARLKPIELLAKRVNEPDVSKGRLVKLGVDSTLLFASLIPIVAGNPLVGAAGIALSGLDIASEGRSVRQDILTRRSQRQRQLRVFDPEKIKSRNAAVRSVADVLARGGDLVPLAIVVDNAEHIDELSVDLLRHVVEKNAKQCLIVFAVNDESSDENAPYTHLEEWLDGIADAEESASDGQRTFHEFDLEKPPSEAMLEIAVHELGALVPDSSALTELIEEADGVPGRLLELLDLPVVRGAIEQGHPLPSGLSALGKDRTIDQRYELLPRDIRRALSTLALHGPVMRGDWAVDALKLHVAFDDAESLLEQCCTSGWLRQTGALIEFGTPGAYRAAARRMDSVLTADQKSDQLEFLQKMVQESQSAEMWSEYPARLRESILVTLLAASESLGPLTVESFERDRWQAERLRLRTATGRGLSADELAAIEKRLADGVPSTLLVVATAEALFDAGHIERAQAVLEHELHRLEEKYGSDDRAVILPLQSIAVFYAAQYHAGNTRESRALYYRLAAETYVRLLDLMVKKLEPTDRRIPDTRYKFAQLLASGFNFSAAVLQASQAITEMNRCPEYGPDAPDTLTRRNNIAAWTGEAGDVAGALRLLKELLPDLTRVLGDDHPDTLTTRNNIAAWTGRAGDAAGALRLFEELLPDLMRVLGDDHPDTLTTRRGIAYWTARANEEAEGEHA